MAIITLSDYINWRENAPKNDIQSKLDQIRSYILSDQWGIGTPCKAWKAACERFFAMHKDLQNKIN